MVIFDTSMSLDGFMTAANVRPDEPMGDGGLDVGRQFIEAGLIDEIAVHMAPVLLGAGVEAHAVAGERRTELERVSVEPAGQMTDLRFRVLK